MKIAPGIGYQGDLIITYNVPSRSRQGLSHAHFARAFKHDLCECEALQFKAIDFKCVHFKAVTIPTPERMDLGKLYDAIRSERPSNEAWQFVGCMKPEFHNPEFLYCQTCPLFPETCNIRLIKHKRNATPLIWRLRSLLTSGHRARAREVYWRIVKNLRDAPERVPTRPRPVDKPDTVPRG